MLDKYRKGLNLLKMQMHVALKIVIAATPMLIAMHVLYAFGKYEIWVPETAFRDVMTVAIMTTGMLLSFLLQSYFVRTVKK